jgi:histidinol-phosphate/aromatic aminotransferase/cobyric acid decarboxylase-like protein
VSWRSRDIKGTRARDASAKVAELMDRTRTPWTIRAAATATGAGYWTAQRELLRLCAEQKVQRRVRKSKGLPGHPGFEYIWRES